MELVKDGILYNTKTSTKIGRPTHQFNDDVDHYETLYLSKNKQYYLFITARDTLLSLLLFPRPINVKVLSNDEASRWAVKYLSADTVKKYFSDKIKEG